MGTSISSRYPEPGDMGSRVTSRESASTKVPPPLPLESQVLETVVSLGARDQVLVQGLPWCSSVLRFRHPGQGGLEPPRAVGKVIFLHSELDLRGLLLGELLGHFEPCSLSVPSNPLSS